MFRSFAILALAAAGLAWSSDARAQANPLGSSCENTIRPQGQNGVLIPGRTTNGRQAIRWTFTGSPVVITCDETVLQADKIVFDDDTQDIQASGNVLLQQLDVRIAAERAEMNGQTKLGTFYNANGIARIGDVPEQKSEFGTQESDVSFWGEEIHKVAEDTYRIRHGSFTTCAQPTPRWAFTLGDATITLDKHAIMKNVVLRVKDVPLFYLPAFYYPLTKEDRATGFLLPTYGASTLRGNTISNAFFWAISRSHDATIYHDWTTKFGQAIGAEYRYIQAPGSRGTMNFLMINTPATAGGDGIAAEAASRRYQLDGDINQGLPHGFRLIGRLNYFTDIALQQVYQDIYDSSERQRRSIVGTLNGNIGRIRLTATAEQIDNFYSRNGRSSRQRNGRMPMVNLSLPDRTIGASRIYYGATGSAGVLVDQPDLDNPTTNRSLFRLDGGPTLRAPLSNLSFLSATANASWRLTRWSESLNPLDDDVQVPLALTRQLFETAMDLTGPVFSRVFTTKGLKHLIEPRFRISRSTSFAESDRVVRIDGVDRIVGGTTQIDYGLINRFLLKRGAPSGSGERGGTLEILSVSLTQSYYSNALASQADPNYDSSGESPFSPISLRASVRTSEYSTGDFTMEIDAEHRAIRKLSATARIENPNTEISADWSKRLVIPGLDSFRTPRHFLSGSTLFRTRTNSLGAAYRFSFDVQLRESVQQRIMAYYNSQCCGISFDWQTSSTPLLTNRGVPTNTTFGISFTLAGIGSFSNPMGSFGG